MNSRSAAKPPTTKLATTKPPPAKPPTLELAKAEAQDSLAALCVRALLERAGLPRHRHSAHVAGLLELSYHQAHRRMTGGAPWSLEELQVVASHHGETLVDLFGEQKSADYKPAMLIAGPLRVTCRLWPGPPQAQHRPGVRIALRGGSEWVVMVAGDTPTPLACTVRRLVIEPKPDRPRRFAILDDDIGVAQGLAAGLVQLGFEARAFATEAQLEATVQFDSFDAYVIDWVLANGTAEALVARLRSQSATCPIALLTGKAGSKEVDEKELVAAIEQHGLLFIQKPVTASIAASQFSAAFANR